MRCDDFRQLLRAYLDEELDDDRRDRIREHLAGCGDCRQWALEQDPTLLFALPSRRQHPSPEGVEACTVAVMAQVRQQRLQRRLGARRRPWLAAAAALVMVAGATTMWRLIADDPAPSDGVSTTVAESGQQSPPPPRVEVDMLGDGVRIYQFAEEHEDDTAVYFVVNPALES